ncbi:MAG: hypothetical protein AAFY29_15875 [Pseudomonadota bacterium]
MNVMTGAMGDVFAVLLGVAILVWAAADGTVRIIRTSKSASKSLTRRLEALEAANQRLEEQLTEAQERIETLERLATDGREQLRRDIDAL